MAKIPYQSVQFSIASGTNGGTISFTPQSGKIKGACLYHNNESGALNSDLVTLRVSTAGGEEVLPVADVKHYRNREAKYDDGYIPLNRQSDNTTYNLTFNSATNFSGAFRGTFVLIYEPETDPVSYC